MANTFYAFQKDIRMIWAVLWTLNIAKYNTIIYYPIIELFKQ